MNIGVLEYNELNTNIANSRSHITSITVVKLLWTFARSTAVLCYVPKIQNALQWHHNGCDSVSNHQPHHCLLNRLFKPRSKKTSKLRVASLCAGNSAVTGEFPTQMPVTRKMFPFDDVILVMTAELRVVVKRDLTRFEFKVSKVLITPPIPTI